MSNAVAVTTQAPPRSVTIDMANRYGMEPTAFEHTMRATVFPSNGSREQFAAFLLVAKVYNLNPLTKEIYAFPAKGGGIVPVVSIDGWMNLINSHPQFDGMEFGVNNDDKGNLVSVTCTIWRKDRSRPTEITEYLDECQRATDPWKMKRRMLRHKAAIQCARYAFGFAGIYDEDEAEKIAASNLSMQTPRIMPPPPPEEPQLQQSQPVAATSDDGTVPPDNSPSDPITEVDVTDWTALLDDFVGRLAGADTYELLEEIRDDFLNTDQMPREISDKALEAYDQRVEALQREEEKREAEKAAAENGKAKRTTKKSTAAQRGAEGGGDASADQASPPPPPPSDDDTFPGDLPPPPPPPVESNAPSHEEVDEALAAQGDFAADFRQQVRVKMRSAGYKRCMMWLKSKEEGMVDIAMKMPDREALSAEGKRIDEERAKAEQQ